ncbi:hypothetical protein SDC9_199746 [bioreactor metagenome]|uniref:Uncharacterized protein n=1 Tax=bioreactor metagenome TaxID=1076179 RepID=A0A645IML3_9ZZZZ
MLERRSDGDIKSGGIDHCPAVTDIDHGEVGNEAGVVFTSHEHPAVQIQGGIGPSAGSDARSTEAAAIQVVGARRTGKPGEVDINATDKRSAALVERAGATAAKSDGRCGIQHAPAKVVDARATDRSGLGTPPNGKHASGGADLVNRATRLINRPAGR